MAKKTLATTENFIPGSIVHNRWFGFGIIVSSQQYLPPIDNLTTEIVYLVTFFGYQYSEYITSHEFPFYQVVTTER